MNIVTSVGLTAAVLALTIAPSVEAQQQVVTGYPAVADVHVPKSVLERYVGEYVYPTGNTITVRLVGDMLVRETGGQQYAFVPITETLFKIGPYFTAEFVIDTTGGVTQILSDGSATEFRLVRREPGGVTPKAPRVALTPEAAAVRVPRAALERYVGEYEFIPGQMDRTDLIIVVRLRGDTLTRHVPGQEEMVLTPITETRFKVGDTSLMAEFVIDGTGAVIHVMGSGSRQLRVIRKTKP